MKITIDTKSKTIQLEEEVIIDDLLKELEDMNIDYTEYKLIPFSQIYTYPLYQPYNQPSYLYQPTWCTSSSASTNAYQSK